MSSQLHPTAGAGGSYRIGTKFFSSAVTAADPDTPRRRSPAAHPGVRVRGTEYLQWSTSLLNCRRGIQTNFRGSGMVEAGSRELYTILTTLT